MRTGRPREHDREQIALELVQWAQKETSINLCEFCCSREPPMAPSKLTHWSNECDIFRQAVETAKAFIGYRRERKLTNNELHVKAYDLNATTYDYFMKQEKRDQMKYEAGLAKEVQSAVPAEIASQHAKLMSEITAAQDSLSARKAAVTSNMNDNKS